MPASTPGSAREDWQGTPPPARRTRSPEPTPRSTMCRGRSCLRPVACLVFCDPGRDHALDHRDWQVMANWEPQGAAVFQVRSSLFVDRPIFVNHAVEPDVLLVTGEVR